MTHFRNLILSLLLIICIIYFTSCHSGSGKAIYKIDYSNLGYCKPTLFIYQANLYDSASALIRRDTISLFTTNNPLKGTDQNTICWRFLTTNDSNNYINRIIDNRFDNSYEGIKVVDSEFFLHPPRENYFRILEFCPYPFFKTKLFPGATWEWELYIGGIWSIDNIYPLDTANEKFTTKYLCKDTATIKTAYGNELCIHILGKESSKFGNSTGEFYLNNDHGLLMFSETTITRQRFQFNLIKIIHNEDSIRRVSSEYPYIMNQLNSSCPIFYQRQQKI